MRVHTITRDESGTPDYCALTDTLDIPTVPRTRPRNAWGEGWPIKRTARGR